VLLFKRSFLLILYFPGGGSAPPGTPRGATGLLPLRYATVPGLQEREMKADVILKEPPSWVPPLSLSGGARVEGGGGGRGPPSLYAPEHQTELFFMSQLSINS